jgi:hypothetical protein
MLLDDCDALPDCDAVWTALQPAIADQLYTADDIDTLTQTEAKPAATLNRSGLCTFRDAAITAFVTAP